MSGIADAAKQIQALGRSPDTMLAHISPDEAQLIDYMQGGRRTNPNTGLPEYGLFGNLLKAVVRAAGGIVGFTLGGPLGAAAGAGLGTKLTGGSWTDALKGAALAGVGGEVGQGLGGGGWNPVGGDLAGGAGSVADAGATAADAASQAGTTGIAEGVSGVGQSAVAASAPEDTGVLSTPMGGSAAATAASSAAPSGLSGILSHIGGYGGLGAGLGALATPLPIPGAAPAAPQQPGFSLPAVTPNQETYVPYTGNYLTYGQTGGQHTFLSNVNPLTPQANYYADGGSVDQPQDQDLSPQGLQAAMMLMSALSAAQNPVNGGNPSSTLAAMNVPFDIQGFASGGSTGKPVVMTTPPPAPPAATTTTNADGTLNLPPVTPYKRNYVPYTGDPLHYAETGGVHQFLDNINPLSMPAAVPASGTAAGQTTNIPGIGSFTLPPNIQAMIAGQQSAQPQAAPGAAAWQNYLTNPAGWTPPATPSAPPAAPTKSAQTPAGLAQLPPNIAAIMQGFNSFARGGMLPKEGQVSGPGTGTSDSIPAMLSDGEHVSTAREISALGGGNNDRGQKRMYKLRRIIKSNPQRVIKAINKTGARA